MTASGFKHLVDASARGKTIDEEEEEEEDEEGQRSWLSEQWEEFNYAILGCGGRYGGTRAYGQTVASGFMARRCNSCNSCFRQAPRGRTVGAGWGLPEA